MKVSVPLSESGLDKLIETLDDITEKVKSGAEELVRELSDDAVEDATELFDRAVYDGTNDVSVQSEVSGSTAKVTASGKKVLFIEFGTGVEYPDSHPEGVKNNMIHGKFGHGHKTWKYRGVLGKNPPATTHPLRKRGEVWGKPVEVEGVYISHGSPSNNCMYNARVHTIERAKEKMKEILK